MKDIRDIFLIGSMGIALSIIGYKAIFKEYRKDINNDGKVDTYYQNMIDNKYTIRLSRENGRDLIFRDVDSTRLHLLKHLNTDSVSKDSLEKILKYQK
jgi:hypothetical protein